MKSQQTKHFIKILKKTKQQAIWCMTEKNKHIHAP